MLLLALIDKGARADLSQAERNELRGELEGFAKDYRAGIKAKVAELRKERTQRRECERSSEDPNEKD